MRDTSNQPEAPRRLRVFLCHSSGDKPAVRELYRRLLADGFDPWLDEEKLLPGQDWREVIPQAVQDSDVVIVCLSPASVTKEGYLQKEVKYALDVADEKPEGTIFIIPLKLEECDIPRRLGQWQWASLAGNGYEKLLLALKARAQSKLPSGKSPTRLRSEPTALSKDAAEVMVVTRDFYHARWNQAGRGIAHQYETKAIQGALVVVDHTTGLMWQRGGSGDVVPAGFEGAGRYMGELNARKYGGFADWRLPTLEEAMSLMTPPEGGAPDKAMYGNEERKGVFHIDRAFEIPAASFIWTADLEERGRGWIVYFWDGICRSENLGFNAYVRAVRSLESAAG